MCWFLAESWGGLLLAGFPLSDFMTESGEDSASSDIDLTDGHAESSGDIVGGLSLEASHLEGEPIVRGAAFADSLGGPFEDSASEVELDLPDPLWFDGELIEGGAEFVAPWALWAVFGATKEVDGEPFGGDEQEGAKASRPCIGPPLSDG